MVDSALLRLNVLGPLEAWREDTRLDLGPMKQQALLAALALRPNATVSQARLLEDVWGQAPPASGAKALAPYVYRLRKTLPSSVLSTEAGGAYRFRASQVTMDLWRFRELREAAETARTAGDWQSAADGYTRALALFRGEPLAGLPGDFAEWQRARLVEERLDSLRRKLQSELELGQHAERIAELRSLTREHPHSEPFAVLLMRALYTDGRQAEAMDVYGRLRTRLGEELGVAPGREAERLYVEMLRGELYESPQKPSIEASSQTSEEFQQAHQRLTHDERAAFALLSRHLGTCLDPLATAALLNRPTEEAQRVLKQLHEVGLISSADSGSFRLHDSVAANAWRHTEAVPSNVVSASHVRVLRLYLAAARCASDQEVVAFGDLPLDLEVPFDGHDESMAWLDHMTEDIVDLIGHAADDGHAEYVCWLAEALTDYFTRRGRFRECHAIIDTALPLADPIPDRRMPPVLRIRKGIAYGMAGRFPQSGEWLHYGAETSRAGEHTREWARAVGGLGTVSRALGRDEEATEQLLEALALARRACDDWLVGMAQCNLGAIHHRHSRYTEASEWYELSLASAEKIGRPRVIGKSLCFAAVLQLDLGNFAEAAERLRRAVRMAQRSGDIPLRVLTLTKLGSAEHGLGNLDTAFALQQRALDLLTRQSSPELETEVRNRLAPHYLASGDVERAREQYRYVVALTESGTFPQQRQIALSGLDNTSGSRPACHAPPSPRDLHNSQEKRP